VHPVIEEFEVDPYYVLQGISLACRKSPSCKRGDVLGISAKDIEEWWGRVVQGLATGLEILRDDCKVMLPKWLPYQTMLPPLAAVVAKMGIPKTARPAHSVRISNAGSGARCSARRTRAPPTASQPRTSRTGAVAERGRSPRDGCGLPFRPQDSPWRHTAAAFHLPRHDLPDPGTGTGARDFHTQAVITGKLMTTEGIDDHHIFPAAFLERGGVAPARLRDCVLNRTLIDRTTNQVISDRAPSDYLAEIRSTPGFPFVAVVASHSLPTESASPLLRDDYDAFSPGGRLGCGGKSSE